MKNSMQLGEWRTYASAHVAMEDADAILQFVTGWNPTQLFMRRDSALSAPHLQSLESCLQRRRDGEPVAYITGRRGFWTLDLLVNEHTLIPRADTETLIEAVLDRVNRSGALDILDLGTGSGAIALALASELKNARVIATDQSEAALEIAQRNAAKHGIRNVAFRQGHWFDALKGDERFHVIVSNPPYIAELDPHLSEGDLRFEPASALSSGRDGLDDIRQILAMAESFLHPLGQIFLEHGYDQGERVRGLLVEQGFTGVSTARDLAGHDRVSLARRRMK